MGRHSTNRGSAGSLPVPLVGLFICIVSSEIAVAVRSIPWQSRPAPRHTENGWN